MSIRLVLPFVISFFSLSVCAQSDSALTRITWSVSVHSGALLANPGSAGSFTATLTPVIHYDNLKMMVGTGYDRYSIWRMVPVFAGIGYDMVRGKQSVLFLQFHAGYSDARSPVSETGVALFYKGGGYFYHPFIGWRITPRKLSLYLTAGYKIQNLNFEEELSGWGSTTKRIIDARISRFSLQIGLGI